MTSDTQEHDDTQTQDPAQDLPQHTGDQEQDQEQDQGHSGNEAAKARREAAELRRRLKLAEQQLAQHEEAGKTELEKATGRAETLEQENQRIRGALRDLTLDTIITREARALGITNPAMAGKLIDHGAIEWDDDSNTPDQGTVTEALRAVIREFPQITLAGDIDAGARSKPPATASGDGTGARINAFIRGNH